jgi:UDP-N-acetylglucosamine 2-epimerase (non-hydrolysing)/GDP/UDP-N,N'-diacetylbacillosamine 2-epimerase (hydrolysing)
MKRKIFVLTGKRGGFGAMKPMLRLLRDDPEVELQLVVTDQHVSERFGKTITEVQQEFSIAAAVDMEQQGDTPVDRARALGVCLTRMSDVLNELKPDACVLYGDRGEVLATAVAATSLGIPIAHLQGGDVSGSVDEQVRHAVTKLAQLHFPSTEESGQRIRNMGEEPWRVHVVGDNHIDLIVAGQYASREEVARVLDLDPAKPVVVVLQHSETTAPDESYDQMVETLVPVCELGMQTVVVHPCSDVGYGGVIRAIEELAVGNQFRVRVNLDAPIFWGLLAMASVFVGNSSAGIVETPTFRLPTVNVGRRQEGRLHAENVLHVPHERAAIRAALETALKDQAFRARAAACSQPYGDGRAGERIVKVLKEVPLDKRLMIKRMTY